MEDEVEGAPTTVLTAQGGSAALHGLWIRRAGVVEGGGLSVENLVGRARVLLGPPPSASVFAAAPARLESLEVGHVRLIAAFEEMRGAGVLEI